MPELQPIKNPFDALDPIIQKWLQSDGVFDVIVSLNKELGCYEDELSVIPEVIVGIAVAKIKPEQTTAKLLTGLPFLTDKQIEHAAEVIKKKIFYPLNPTFKKYGIDYEKIATTIPAPEKPKVPEPPVAREVPFSAKAPTVAKAMVGESTGKPSSWQQTPVEAPKARTMEFTPMTDVKRPEEIKIPINKPPAVQPKAPEPSIVPAVKPFGLSDTKPQRPPEPVKPAPHELTPYQDEHPVKRAE